MSNDIAITDATIKTALSTWAPGKEGI